MGTSNKLFEDADKNFLWELPNKNSFMKEVEK